MKKWLVFLYLFLALTVILFCMNLFRIEQNKKKKEQQEIEEKKEKNTIEYKADQTIRVKYTKTGEIVAMDINDYLRGVVPSEMSPTYNMEALKAQALVARTYTYRKLSAHAEGEDADMCDSYAHCQAFYPKEKLFEIWRRRGYDERTILDFWDRINTAVVSTQNEIITYNGECIKAFFHASSPQGTEDISQIWGGETLSYLVKVESLEDESYSNRTSTVEINCDEFLNKLKENNLCKGYNSSDIKNIKIGDYTITGRVKNVQIRDQKVSAEKLRTMIGLKSTNFTIEIKDSTVIFHVIGYGHGVGMSQVGANYYGSHGMDYRQIIEHYYTGVKIEKLN
ncbi:MAG: stage II sporulation protein D [Clostridia bacterium]|nr:stage II sporulation protein D [Clostridia bacterium]